MPEYVLVQDLATRQEPLRLREQDRAWFAEDLEEVARSFRKAERAGLGVVGEEVIQALPAAVRAAALQGRHVAIPSAEFTPQLRQMALTFLGPNGGPSEAARVEVYLEGEGDHLTLTTLFMEAGRGGSGSRFQPRRYLRRFSGDGAIRPNISVSGRPSVPRSYQGLAALPLNLNEEEAKRWRAVRTMPELLQLLHDRTGAGFVCDDYDYGVYWGAATRTPAGEPLGYWLDALVESVRTSRRLDGCRLEWREVDGCLLLRNPGWYADDALRPPADVTAWLVEARAVQPGRVLTISEAAGLLARLDVHQRATLARSGLLPKERLAGVGAVARLLEIVNSAQRAKLFSPGGLKVSQLSPHQRQLATAEGPGLTPVYSQWVLENQQGGELTLVLKQMEEGYRRRMECPARGPVEFSVQLRLPEENPEVCRVRVVEAQGR